jgi:hypothetical protein
MANLHDMGGCWRTELDDRMLVVEACTVRLVRWAEARARLVSR